MNPKFPDNSRTKMRSNHSIACSRDSSGSPCRCKQSLRTVDGNLEHCRPLLHFLKKLVRNLDHEISLHEMEMRVIHETEIYMLDLFVDSAANANKYLLGPRIEQMRQQAVSLTFNVENRSQKPQYSST